MIFGDPSVFAIECEMASTCEGWVFAHLRIWANGAPLGDFSENVILSGCVKSFAEFLNEPSGRSEPEIACLPAEEVFALLYDSIIHTTYPGERLHDALVRWNAECHDDSEGVPNARARFHLDDVCGASFVDHVSVVLVEDDAGDARLLWRDLQTMQLSEASFKTSIFNRACNDFLEWARIQLSRTASHE